MPYPNGYGFNVLDLAMGITPITTSLMAAGGVLVTLLGAEELARRSRREKKMLKHWEKVREPGHWNKLDNECLDMLHVARKNRKFTRDHLNEWDLNLKERGRQSYVEGIDAGLVPLVVWKRINADKATLDVDVEADGRHCMTFGQPRATARFMHGKQVAVVLKG